MSLIHFSERFFSELRRIIRKVDNIRAGEGINIQNKGDSLVISAQGTPSTNAQPFFSDEVVFTITATGPLSGTLTPINGQTPGGYYTGQIYVGLMNQGETPPGSMQKGKKCTVVNFTEVVSGTTSLPTDGQTYYHGKVIGWNQDQDGTPIVGMFMGGEDAGTIVRLDSSTGSGGLYLGPQITGHSNVTSTGEANMPNGMTVGSVQCVIINAEETTPADTGWRCSIGAYANGRVVGKTSDTGVPIVVIRGALGDITSPTDLPTGTFTAPDTTYWDWTTGVSPQNTPHAIYYHPITTMGYDGTPQAQGTVVTNTGSRQLWFQQRTVTLDARGVTRHVGAEQTSIQQYIQLQELQVVTNVSWDGSTLSVTKQTVIIMDMLDDSTTTTLFTTVPCTGS